MIAVIAGTTGLVGSLVLSGLLSDPEIAQVISVTRKPLKIHHPKLQQILLSDLAELSGHGAQLKGELYFCCLGTTLKSAGSRENFRKVDYDAVLEFGRIAAGHRARAFGVVSAAGASHRSPFFYPRVKGEADRDLGKLNLKRLVILKPSFLIGDRKDSRPAERMLIEGFKRISFLLPGALKNRVMTDAQTLATQMIRQVKQAAPEISILRANEIHP